MLPFINYDEEVIGRTYKEAIRFTKAHYENFPVLSIFLPRKIYQHVAIVYQFARQADDIADDPNYPAAERIKKLDEFKGELEKTLEGKPSGDFWMAFYNTVRIFNLSPVNFFRLLKAFRQDLVKTSYGSFDQLLEYCINSANPVGRIILELLDIRDEKRFEQSDKICTALQITNFMQDSAADIQNGRNYYPEEFLEKFNVEREALAELRFTEEIKKMLEYETTIIRQMYFEGRGLLNALPYRMKIQISATINGGLEILNKIEKNGYDVFNYRPKLSKFDLVKIFTRTLLIAE